VSRAVHALGEAGVATDHLTSDNLGPLARLAGAASELADCVARQRVPPGPAVHTLNRLAFGSIGTRHVAIAQGRVHSYLAWHDRDPVAALARQVIEELDELDMTRVRACGRDECGLLFFDATRSRTQRWHAEDPCGWLARQQRLRARRVTTVINPSKVSLDPPISTRA